MSIEFSNEAEARRQAISVDEPVEGPTNERERAAAAGPVPELPVLHLGAMGALRRRDICNDVG